MTRERKEREAKRKHCTAYVRRREARKEVWKEREAWRAAGEERKEGERREKREGVKWGAGRSG